VSQVYGTTDWWQAVRQNKSIGDDLSRHNKLMERVRCEPIISAHCSVVPPGNEGMPNDSSHPCQLSFFPCSVVPISVASATSLACPGPVCNLARCSLLGWQPAC
jgi:hypothetical protein